MPAINPFFQQMTNQGQARVQRKPAWGQQVNEVQSRGGGMMPKPLFSEGQSQVMPKPLWGGQQQGVSEGQGAPVMPKPGQSREPQWTARQPEFNPWQSVGPELQRPIRAGGGFNEGQADPRTIALMNSLRGGFGPGGKGGGNVYQQPFDDPRRQQGVGRSQLV